MDVNVSRAVMQNPSVTSGKQTTIVMVTLGEEEEASSLPITAATGPDPAGWTLPTTVGTGPGLLSAKGPAGPELELGGAGALLFWTLTTSASTPPPAKSLGGLGVFGS